MKLPRRTFLHMAAGAAALPVVSRITLAQAYPTPGAHRLHLVSPSEPSETRDPRISRLKSRDCIMMQMGRDFYRP